ncbi:hypothetical protein [Paenibacillus glycanilyticus]|uniref:hypothetical protein n=1 Tax=Paenibacillus glycanilyticus TaxID=126569 RepID=UPI003EBB49CC
MGKGLKMRDIAKVGGNVWRLAKVAKWMSLTMHGIVKGAEIRSGRVLNDAGHR